MNIKEEHNHHGFGSYIIEISDHGIYDNIPELNYDGVNDAIKVNTLFKYDYCYYTLESSGELVFNSSGEASGRLVIPESIMINGKSYPVTRIGVMTRYKAKLTEYGPDRRKKPDITDVVLKYGAFFGTKVTECVFPATIRDFSGDIIYGLEYRESVYVGALKKKGLTSVALNKISFAENGSCQLSSIGDNLFENCYLEMDCLHIPEGVRHIGDKAFSGTFARVKLPSTIETVGRSAFKDCRIKSINLPEGLERVGEDFIDLTDFLDCIEFPSTIKTIPYLDWNLSRRKDFAKSLPELIIHNEKKDVSIDKDTAKHCKIQFISKTGKKAYKRNTYRNYLFSTGKLYSFEDLDKKYKSVMFIILTIAALVVISFMIWGYGMLVLE